MAVDCVWDLGATLGEGPLWMPDQAALWFVDIKRHHIHRLIPETGVRSTWEAPDQVGWVQPTAGGRWLAGLKSGIHWFDPEATTFSPFLDPEPDKPGNRLNDSWVDPAGRLWFGTMDDGESAATGQLYHLADGPAAIGTGLICPITNGPAVSPDGKTLYHVDTLGRRIHRLNLDDRGNLSGDTVLIEIAEGEGHPDGPCIDSEGCIWASLFGGWGVRRYSPAGELLQTVELPVANVTKIALGGPDLRTAYATTAAKGLSDAEREAQPLAGGVFSFCVEVPGLPTTPVSIGV